MAHELEILENGEASMVWAGETPWHGLGTKVPDDLTPEQMLKAANLDWNVEAIPAYAEIAGEQVDIGRSALVRDRDNKILDIISSDWKPCQNIEAFEFFNDFIAAGDMKMHTAGSLKGGQIVWALAEVDETFTINGGKDKVDAYLQFTNPHKYGQSIDVRMTAIRCVCWNTVSASLNQKSKNFIKVNHRRELDPESVKEALGITKHKLALYKEMAEHLSSKRYKDEDVVEYFKRIFPLNSEKAGKENELSRNAKLAKDVYMHTQPGAELGEGTWWQAHCAVTYMVDHILGRTADNRLASAWYGGGDKLKHKSLDLAMEMSS